MVPILVVAGEASGDAWAAAVLRRLSVPSFGLGGRALLNSGTNLVADLRRFSAMGIGSAVARAPAVASALVRLVRRVRDERPAAALLVGFSEVNARLAPWLRARGTRVVWYAPPQVWAWRPRRARRLAFAADRLAVVLPFEEPLWRRTGARAEYVGHPALELRDGVLPELDPPTTTLLVLPGSRAHEVRKHLSVLIAAAVQLRESLARAPVLVLSPSLDEALRRTIVEECERHRISVHDGPLSAAARGAHLALVASGTATLECAVLSVPPIIVHRTGALTHAVASRLVRVRHIGLPNLLLEGTVFPELVQDDFTVPNVVAAARQVSSTREPLLRACERVRQRLRTTADATPSARVAAMVAEFL